MRQIRQKLQRILDRCRSERGESASFMVLVGGLAIAAIAGASTLGGVVEILAQQVGGEGGDRGGRDIPAEEFPDYEPPPPFTPFLPPIPCIILCDGADEPAEPQIPGPFDPNRPQPDPEGTDDDGGEDNDPEEGDPEDDEPADDEPTETLEDFGPWPYDELRDAVNDAIRFGDLERAQELSDIFLTGLEGMDYNDAYLALQALDPPQFMILMATADLTGRDPSVLQLVSDQVIANDEAWSLDVGSLHVLEELLPGINDELWRTGGGQDRINGLIYDNLLAEPDGYTVLSNSIKAEGDRVGRREFDVLGEKFAEHLIANPHKLDADVQRTTHAADAASTELQNVLEVINNGVGEQGLNEVMTAYAVSLFDGVDLSDPESIRDNAQQLIAKKIGLLEYQISEAGSDASFDPTKLALLAGKQIPGASLAVSGVGAIIAGYEGDTTYADLSAAEKRNEGRFVVSVLAVSAASPELQAEIEAVQTANPGLSPYEVIHTWADQGSDLFNAVSAFETLVKNSSQG